jgi:Transposase
MNLPDFFPGCTVDHVHQGEGALVVHGAMSPIQATCPHCGMTSRQVHGVCHRHPKALPWSDHTVQLDLHVTRFRCGNPNCATTTFGASLAAFVSKYAQQTNRLRHIQARMGLHLSANDSVHVLKSLNMSCSRYTVLRSLRHIDLPTNETPRFLGVDDWAIRKGKRYGTILVDLERHRVVDLLEGRDGTALQTWLEAHPGVEVIARDRANEYSHAVNHASPQGVQVADRFHLVQNLGSAIQTWLERRKGSLLQSLHDRQTVILPPPPAFRLGTARAPFNRITRKLIASNNSSSTAKFTPCNSKACVRHKSLVKSAFRTAPCAVGCNERSSQNGWVVERASRHRMKAFLRDQLQLGNTCVAELHRALLDRGYRGSKGPIQGFVRW